MKHFTCLILVFAAAICLNLNFAHAGAKHQDTAWVQCPLPGSDCKKTAFSGSTVHKVKVITPKAPTKAQQESHLKMMAGFGAPKKKEDVKVGTGGKALKKQAATFAELVKAGSRPFEVFVREAGTPQWNLAGEVAAEGGEAAAAPCTHLQRGLIAAVARERYPVLLKLKDQQLEAGLRLQADAEVAVVPREGAERAGRCGFQPVDPPEGGFNGLVKKTSSNIMGGQEIQLADSKGRLK